MSEFVLDKLTQLMLLLALGIDNFALLARQVAQESKLDLKQMVFQIIVMLVQKLLLLLFQLITPHGGPLMPRLTLLLPQLPKMQ
jgi:hypothetical protein